MQLGESKEKPPNVEEPMNPEEEDEEEPSDPQKAKKNDDENMACVAEKIIRKIAQGKETGML